ncbi:MAG: GTP-binding protein, partial [Clostridia bacterium]|nr:GTP-binding protein [Clostridia bacterium]
MKQYTSQQIKNIAFLGHGGSGKTTLVDSILYYGKAVERIGKIADGTTVMDFDSEEKKRKTSVQLSAFPLEINDGKWNILDAPGLFDFEAGVSEALSAADNALIVLSGKSGMTVGAQQSYQKAKALNKPTAFFIGKLDSNHAHFYRVIS